MKNKVLYISSESSLGGASQSLCDMLTYIKEYIHPIVVVPAKGDLENRLAHMHVKTYLIPLSRGFGEIGQHTLEDEERDFVVNYRAALEIKDIIEKESVELVHINSSVCNAGAMGAILTDVPYVWHLREIMEEHFGCEFWDADLKRSLFKRTDKFIAISGCVQTAYRDRHAIVSQIIYDGIDAGRYVQAIQRKEMDSHSFILAGNISEAKGQIDAIRAVAILVKEGISNIRLHIVGGYSARFAWGLKRYVNKYGLEENIILHCFMSDLSELRRKCAYAIVSSKFEALGRVTVEAMMAGNIVIGVNTGGTIELIGEDKERGYIYTQGSPDSLAEAMLEAIQEGENRKRKIREQAQAFALSNFDTKEYAINICNVYKEILGQKKAKDSNINFQQYLINRYTQHMESGVTTENKLSDKGKIVSEMEKEIEENENGIKSFLNSMNINSVAIYGMGRIGCKLYDMLEHLKFKIPYVIDRDSYLISEVIEVLNPEDNVREVDALIITVVEDSDRLKMKYDKTDRIRKIFEIGELIEKCRK